MNLIILASVLVFILILRFFIKKNDKEMTQTMRGFLEKEQAANFVRKKPLDDLPYVTIPDFILTMTLPDDPDFAEAKRMITHLKDTKIVNFTGVSNTDLKYRYGTANIGVLSEYDQNYLHLLRSLHGMGKSLLSAGRKDDARKVWEYAVEIGSDMMSTYLSLAEIYHDEGHPEEIEELIFKASLLPSITSKSITRKLRATFFSEM